ncbi:hypothetical protein BDY19DRAFT_531172 [Irpex rosettiformis]|uniref:Uncharacterized protein n=1 Tax=Irpex rosettiformis TaxID=378272 RepID=A0ACB8TR85_9APHY|nr:hypothetical protein BDY19DRAFT_531172 [Irpex rosettiformis]
MLSTLLSCEACALIITAFVILLPFAMSRSDTLVSGLCRSWSRLTAYLCTISSVLRRRNMAWTLPSELDDIILDHLHDDPLTLSHCALVQKSWLPTARYHLWNHPRLNCTSDELTKFRILLTTTSPAVGCYIRSVVVKQKKGEACQWYDLNLLHYALSVLSLLPNLHTLTLDGLWFGAPKLTSHVGIPFPIDGDTGQTADHDLCVASQVVSSSVQKLNISTCSFDNFEDVQQLCLSFPTLSRVQFDGVWWGRWAHEPSRNHRALSDVLTSSVVPKMALRELDLGSCFSRDQIVEWLLDAMPGNTVETLKLPLIGAQDTRLRELLGSMGGSLKHLEIGSPSTAHNKSGSNDVFVYQNTRVLP